MIGGGALAALVIVAGNIMSNPAMPPADVRHDTARLFELRADVVCANEIAPPSYKRTFRQLARAAGYRTAELSRSPDAVAVRRASHWRTATVRVRQLSRGVEHITPDRSVTVAQLVDGRGGRIVVLCTHLVSRAWTHVESSTELRQTLWRAEARRLRAIVSRWRARGVPVVVAGDLNHPRAVRWARRQRVLANSGLIQLTAIPPAGYSVRRLRGRTIPASSLYTDHPMLRRSLALVP